MKSSRKTCVDGFFNFLLNDSNNSLHHIVPEFSLTKLERSNQSHSTCMRDNHRRYPGKYRTLKIKGKSGDHY